MEPAVISCQPAARGALLETCTEAVPLGTTLRCDAQHRAFWFADGLLVAQFGPGDHALRPDTAPGLKAVTIGSHFGGRLSFTATCPVSVTIDGDIEDVTDRELAVAFSARYQATLSVSLRDPLRTAQDYSLEQDPAASLLGELRRLTLRALNAAVFAQLEGQCVSEWLGPYGTGGLDRAARELGRGSFEQAGFDLRELGIRRFTLNDASRARVEQAIVRHQSRALLEDAARLPAHDPVAHWQAGPRSRSD